MRITILGAGAMGAALTIPYSEKNEVVLWGTEYDIDILDKIKRGEEHPRIGIKVIAEKILYPDELEKALDSEIILMGVSTEGVMSIFKEIESRIEDQILITIAKGFIERDEILTIPEAIWGEREDLKDRVVAVTGPSIAKEVAFKLPTHVTYSSTSEKTLKIIKNSLETHFYRIETSKDIIGCEIGSALKNVYSIAISWIRGIESRKHVTMNNLKGIIVSMALKEISKIVVAKGGKWESVYGFTGIGDLIATFRGGRNGMFGELLGKGYDVESALKELQKKGVGVIEGYTNASRAYRLAEELDNKGKLRLEDLKLLNGINDVLYHDGSAEDVIDTLF